MTTETIFARQMNMAEHIELVIESTQVGIWDWDIETSRVTFNEQWAKLIGFKVEELLPMNFDKLLTKIHPLDVKTINTIIAKHFNDNSGLYSVEFRMLHKMGHYVWIQANGKLIEHSLNGNPKRMIGTHVDISQKKVNAEKLETNAQLLYETQHIGKLGGWQLNLKTNELFWTDETYALHDTSPTEFNPTYDAGLDYYLPESKDILIEALDKAINKGIGYDLELQTYTKKSRKIDIRTTCVVTLDQGVPTYLTGIFQDITDHKSNQRKLEQANIDLLKANSDLKFSSNYDLLTGLPNRNLLTEKIEHTIQQSLQSNTLVAIAFIDLDCFKNINDNYGHHVGDKFLKVLSQKFKTTIRECDTISRFGGDEFVAVINRLTNQVDGEKLISKLLSIASEPIKIDNMLINVTASIGITYFPSDNSNPDQLLRHADQAMYKAKQDGKNQIKKFNIKENQDVITLNEKLKRITQALEMKEFVLYYQPKVDLRTKSLIGVEALIRWNHPVDGVLPPAMFLPEIENDLLDIEIGKWVIETAFNQSKKWTDLGHDIPISVNISPMHLQHPQFVSDLKSTINGYPDFKGGSIEFEILETSALKDINRVSMIMKKCNALGITFSIDDFGTGYSSLTYLKQLPAKYLKIDQSFIRNMLDDIDDKSIVKGIIELAKVFNLQVIAEGVETPEHGDLLLSLGSHIAQGYGISKPISNLEVLPWLKVWKEKPFLIDGSI